MTAQQLMLNGLKNITCVSGNMEVHTFNHNYIYINQCIFRTHALRNTKHFTRITTSTYFGNQVPSSGIYYNKSIRAKLLIYVMFISIT
jgi:hypothetical protein